MIIKSSAKNQLWETNKIIGETQSMEPKHPNQGICLLQDY